MDALDRLLARAAAADGLTRIEFRNDIAAFGDEAVRRLEPWLADPRLGTFAVLTIQRAGSDHGATTQALATLRRARPRCPDSVRGDLDSALGRLDGRPSRSSKLRAHRVHILHRNSPEPLPPSVKAVVAAWIAAGKPAQPARSWHQQQWLAAFPQYRDLLSNLPTKIDRAAIRPACADVTRDAIGAERALVAVMAWGAIDFGYRCKWTIDMLATPKAGERLLQAALTLAEQGPLAGYRRLYHTGDCHLTRLGESFASKFMYFCQPDGQSQRALILDSLVNEWLQRYAGLAFSSGRGSESGYASYILSMHAWAAELGCKPDEVEFCIFRAMAAERGSGWGD
jgi:hypothetical protein